MRKSAVFVAAAALTAGCYSTSTVAPGRVRTIGHPADAPIQMSSSWEAERLGPRTAVRARRADGTVTPWFKAGSISTSKHGLLTGRSLALGKMSVAVVRGLGPDGAALVSMLSPPDGQMWMEYDQVTLQAQRPGDMAHWAAAVASGSMASGGPAGVWTFYAPGTGWITENLGGGTLAAVPLTSVGRLRIMEGIPWSDMKELELNNFDPATSVAAVGAGALLVAMVIASAKSNGNPGPIFDIGARVAVTAIDASEQNPDLLPPLERDENRHEGFLVDPQGADGSLVAAPLFTGSARRRDIAKLLLSVDSAWDGKAGVTGGAGVGLRLFDFWELSARVRGLHLGAGAVEGETSGPTRLLAGGRLALHIDGDAEPLSAMTMGLEILAGRMDDSRAITMTTLSIGPRFGIGRKTFLSLLVSPTYVHVEDPEYAVTVGTANTGGPSEWRLLFGAELGLAL